MKSSNVIQEKSYEFAIRIVHLYKKLIEEKHEYVLSKQVLRSGTSVGANVEEAIGAQTKKDFIAKLAIAYKEARETSYWIRIMRDTNLIDEKTAAPILEECEQIKKILAAIQKTMAPKIFNS